MRRRMALCRSTWLRPSPALPYRLTTATPDGGRGGGRCEQRLTSGLPKPITAPCGSLTQLLVAEAPLQGHGLSRAVAWAYPTQRSEAWPPQKIATFNSYAEAPEPMAGAR
jgi:hypothetical protein